MPRSKSTSACMYLKVFVPHFMWLKLHENRGTDAFSIQNINLTSREAWYMVDHASLDSVVVGDFELVRKNQNLSIVLAN